MRPSGWETIVGWAGLALWTLVPLVAIAWPQRQPDPQRGMAVGLLLFVALTGLAAAALHGIGVRFQIRWLEEMPFRVTSFVAMLMLAGGLLSLKK
jgi:hypothetical protein